MTGLEHLEVIRNGANETLSFISRPHVRLCKSEASNA